MMSSLLTLPTARWWDSWWSADRDAARATFAAMSSGSGFTTDLVQGRIERSAFRESAQRSVPCPTLVTGSESDGGVSIKHAEDFALTIPQARLLKTNAASHFYWLGADRSALSRAVGDFVTAGRRGGPVDWSG